MPNKIFKKLTSGDSPHESAASRLYFMNMLNNAGPNGKPANFNSYYEASKSCPGLAKICDKLSGSEVKQLVDRIENIL